MGFFDNLQINTKMAKEFLMAMDFRRSHGFLKSGAATKIVSNDKALQLRTEILLFFDL